MSARQPRVNSNDPPVFDLHTLGELFLRDASGEVCSTRRKELALLAYLARSARRSVTRGELAALLWDERTEQRARQSLRQALLQLRRQLGEGLHITAARVSLAEGVVELDAAAFEAELRDGRLEDAVARWQGDFLADAEELGGEVYRAWVEEERAALRRLLAHACEQLVARCERQQRWGEAAGWAQRWAAALPFDERAQIRLIDALRRDGRAAQALACHAGFVARLHHELGLDPSPELLELGHALEQDAHLEITGLSEPGGDASDAVENDSDAVGPAGTASEHRDTPRPDPRPQPRAPVAPSESSALRFARSRQRVVWAAIIATVLLGTSAAAHWLRRPAAESDRQPVIAVGHIHDYTGAAPSDLASALSDMLATNLARVPGLRVVSNGRLYEILGRAEERQEAAAAFARAARLAGADELLEGSLHAAPGGGLRLGLRRIDLQSGTTLEGYTVDGADAFALVDRATLRLSAEAGHAASTRLTELATSSLVAYRFYGEGLNAYYQGDAQAATRLFSAALTEDSSFAMAAYYLSLSQEVTGDPASNETLVAAARLAERATDRERLLIQTAWADVMEEPRSLALAETLAIRYPMEPDGHYFLGRAWMWRGDFLGAVPHLRRVIEMDSLGLRNAKLRCRACDALADLVQTYAFADSLPAAERTAREWVRLQPYSARTWNALAAMLEYQDEYAAARAARRRAAPLQPGHRMVQVYPALISIRAGEFEAADRALRELVEHATPDVRDEALWFLAISLRYQGRMREALATARRLRETGGPIVAHAQPALPYEAVLEGQILLEMGRPRDAAALFDSLVVRHGGPDVRPRHRRNRTAWLLTHHATARAAAGDTAVLARLAGTIEAFGRQSALGRDRRLHHHVRGLLLAAQGQPVPAASEFRKAQFSFAGGGYTRTHYELGRLYLELGRPRDAVAVLRPALRGPLDAANLYLSRTELHAALGQAYAAAGERDSAATHYRWVLDAWQHADPELLARRDSVRVRLARLE